MRRPLLLLGILALSTVRAQFAVPEIFRIDPYQANGYFIVDETYFNNKGLDHVVVDIIRTDHTAQGPVRTTIASLTIDNTQFWDNVKADQLEEIAPTSVVHYRVRGFAANGSVVEDIEPARWNGDPSYHACHQVCIGDNYAWQLTSRSNYTQTLSTIDILEAPFYFYVPAGEFQAFMDANDPPTELGLSAWSTYVNSSAISNPSCFPLQVTPEYATGPNGIGLDPNTGAVWAIHKKKGPWRGLYGYTDVAAGTGQVCVNDGENLVNYFNADPIVQDHIADLPTNPGPLACPNGTLYPLNYDVAGGEIAVGCEWIELMGYSAETSPDGDIDIIEVVLYALRCTEGEEGDGWEEWPPVPAPAVSLSDVSSVMINKWSDGGGRVLSVGIPQPPANGGPIDPKLIPVEKAELQPGLYEVLIVMNDGTMRRRFEEITTTKKVGADFDSFVQTNIYPVPVKDTEFAIDFDLYTPMDIDLTITNNMGNTFYTKELNFSVAGTNKHVVEMVTQWPNGIYHAILHYTDGTSGTRSFTVQHD